MSRNLLYSAVSAASAVLLLALSYLILRALGQEGWGDFSFALSLAMIGEALMDFGIHQVTIRAIARDRKAAPALFRNSLALKAAPGLAMFVVMTGAAWLLRPEPTLRLVCTLMIGSAVFRSYLLTVRGVLQGLERFGDDSLVVVIDRLILLGAGAAALHLGSGLVGLAVAFVAGRGIAVAAAFAIAHRHVGAPQPEFDTVIWRDIQRRALPLGAFLVALNLYSYLDTILLRNMTTAVETGLYNSAYRVYEGLTYAPAILSAVLIPRLSHLWSVRRPAHAQLVRRGLAGAMAIAVALAAVTWIAAPVALTYLPNAAPAASTLRILASGLVFVFVIWTLQAVAISVFEERLLLTTTVIGAACNVALNLALIPHRGRDGAALATVISEALTMLMLFWGLRRALRGEGPSAK